MEKIIIVYGSTLGNTERMSQVMEGILRNSGADVTVKKVGETEPEKLSGYDVIMLGCSTWGDGELQNDFISFEERMRDVKLENRKAAVFGPGDSLYPQFCKAVDVLEEGLRECGADIIVDSLKIDGEVEEKISEMEAWARTVLTKSKLSPGQGGLEGGETS